MISEFYTVTSSNDKWNLEYKIIPKITRDSRNCTIETMKLSAWSNLKKAEKYAKKGSKTTGSP